MRRHSGPGRPPPTWAPSSRVTGMTPRVAALSQISSALRNVGFTDRYRTARQLFAGGKFLDEAARRARQQLVAARRREYLAAHHHVHGRGAGVGQPAIAQQNGLGRAGLDRLLSQQHVGQQRHRLDVAARPARVRGRDAGHAVFKQSRPTPPAVASRIRRSSARPRAAARGCGQTRRHATPAGTRRDRRRRWRRPARCTSSAQRASLCGLRMRSSARLRRRRAMLAGSREA